MMTHGTISAYHRGCRCKACEQAKRDQMSRNGRTRTIAYDRQLLGEALREIAPMGLTDDCPARALEKTLAEPSTTAGVNRPASSRASR
jgi:hypothetical protein